MQADLDPKRKQSFWEAPIWETPKGIAAVIAATTVVIGALACSLGYQIGRSPPQTINVHLDAPLAPSPGTK